MAKRIADDEEEIEEATSQVGDVEDVFEEDFELEADQKIPEGWYPVTLSEFQKKLNKTGDTLLFCQWQVTQPGEWQNETLFDNILIKKAGETKQYPQTRWRVDLVANALKCPKTESGTWKFNRDTLLERPAYAQVVHTQSKDGSQTYVNIKSYRVADEEAVKLAEAFYSGVSEEDEE